MFKPGKSGNPAGRPAGSENVLSNAVRKKCADGIEKRMDDYWKHLDSLKGEAYCRQFTKMLEFFLPKLRAVEADISIDTDDELVTNIATKIFQKALQDGTAIKYDPSGYSG